MWVMPRPKASDSAALMAEFRAVYSGTGYFDMVAYEKFHNGQMTDYIPTDEELAASFATLPKVPGQEG